MISTLQEKYKFDMTLGHYVSLYEDDNTQQSNDNQNDNAAKQSGEQPSFPNIDTPEISTMQQNLSRKIEQSDKSIQQANNTINQLQSKLADEKSKVQQAISNGEDVSIKNVSSLMQQLIQQQIDLEKKIFDKAKIQYDNKIQILQAQFKLIESMPGVKMPEKYMHLNESNIHKAKIYINSLVGDDTWHLLHGMVDVKKCFGNSYLLYGKDKKGYFTVCIDQEDFDRMYNALQDIGYSRDVIIDAIMPQIFDRGDFVKKTEE